MSNQEKRLQDMNVSELLLLRKQLEHAIKKDEQEKLKAYLVDAKQMEKIDRNMDGEWQKLTSVEGVLKKKGVAITPFESNTAYDAKPLPHHHGAHPSHKGGHKGHS